VLLLAEDNRLKKNKDFKQVYKYGKSSANKLLVLYYLKNNSNEIKIGFSVSKKIGNAVIRNKVKRVLREICRNNFNNLNVGYNLIFIARKGIIFADYKAIEKALIYLLKNKGILKGINK
jgi:ribonuclease P protein component